MDKPDVEYIEGLSPAISIDQKGVSNNPRSTVGTVTEVYDYLRLLFARVGRPHCYRCGRPVQHQTAQQVTEAVLSRKGARLMLLRPSRRPQEGRAQRRAGRGARRPVSSASASTARCARSTRASS